MYNIVNYTGIIGN